MRGGRSTPTDLRPSPANRTIPHKVTAVSIYDKGPGDYMVLSRILQMDFGESSSRTRMNTSNKRKGQGTDPSPLALLRCLRSP